MMEMYADEEARGGVLEPEGIVGIKYRKERQLETMARLDPVYGSLKRKSQSTFGVVQGNNRLCLLIDADNHPGYSQLRKDNLVVPVAKCPRAAPAEEPGLYIAMEILMES